MERLDSAGALARQDCTSWAKHMHMTENCLSVVHEDSFSMDVWYVSKLFISENVSSTLQYNKMWKDLFIFFSEDHKLSDGRHHKSWIQDVYEQLSQLTKKLRAQCSCNAMQACHGHWADLSLSALYFVRKLIIIIKELSWQAAHRI